MLSAPLRIAAVLGVVASTAYSNADQQQGEAHLSDMLLTGVRDSRDRLRKGIVRARSRAAERFETSPQPASFFVAFDADERQLRFDYVRHGRFRDTEGQNGLGASRIRDVNHHYIRRADVSIRFDQISGEDAPGEITIYRSDEPLAPGVKIYDVRAIGLLTAGALRRRWELSEVFDRVYDVLPPSEATDEGAGVWRLCATSRDGGYRYCLWVDRPHGFTPIRLEESARAVRSSPGGPNKWPWSPVFTSTVTWAKVNDVWVPVTWQIADRKGGDTLWSCTYELEWESVNEAPASELFEAESLNAPKGSLVTNAVGREPFIERLVGVADSPLEGTRFGKHGSVKRVAWTGFQIALLIAGTLLGACLLMLRICKRRVG